MLGSPAGTGIPATGGAPMRMQRPGIAVTAGRQLPSLAGERLLRVQPDQPTAVARLLLTTPGARPHDHTGQAVATRPAPPPLLRRILVTGALGGIGRATTVRLADAGHVVFAAARRAGRCSDRTTTSPRWSGTRGCCWPGGAWRPAHHHRGRWPTRRPWTARPPRSATRAAGCSGPPGGQVPDPRSLLTTLPGRPWRGHHDHQLRHVIDRAA
jgi:hypothetical protein